MTDTTIRRMPAEEMLDALFPLTSYAFHASPPYPDREQWDEAVRERKGVTYLALFEDDAAVASVASTAMSQHVRGKIFDAGGVWGVATHPAARRKGYCKRLMARLLAEEREAGHPLSNLYPFRESFYERLGYVTFPMPTTTTFKPGNLLSLMEQDLGGEVELVLSGDGYDVYRDHVCQMQQQVHGVGVFVHGQKARAQRDPRFWLALAKIRGRVAGLMLYHIKGKDVGELTLQAYRFYYNSSQAKYLLLQWLARHVDQAAEVELWLPPFERPETWLSDMQVTIKSQDRAPMGRIVDVASLSGMETGPGCLTAQVTDPLCPWNEGVWRFETKAGRLQVSPVEGAGCELSVQALAALVYGSHDPADFAWRGWGNPTATEEATMRAMFPLMQPFLHEYF